MTFHAPSDDLEKQLREYDRIRPVDYLASGFLGLSALLGLFRADEFAVGLFFFIGCALFLARWREKRSLLKRWGAALAHEKAQAAAEEAARAERMQQWRQGS